MGPSVTRILLIRHGETDWNRLHRFQGRSDLPLNLNGRNQAHALAMELKEEPLTAIYSSPLIRAMETARIVNAFHPTTPFFEEKGLVEMDFGEFEGMEARKWSEENPDFRKVWFDTPSSLRMPGGESLEDVQRRAVAALEGITRRHSCEDTLLLCSHNFVNVTILCHALHLPLDRFREVRQETAALNLLSCRGGRLEALVVNGRSLLKGSDD